MDNTDNVLYIDKCYLSAVRGVVHMTCILICQISVSGGFKSYFKVYIEDKLRADGF